MGVLADTANVTREGKLNVIGTFDTIGAKSFPVQHLQMVFVFRLQADWEDSGKTYSIVVRLVDQDGQKVLPDLEGEVEIPDIEPGEYHSANQIMNLTGVVFEHSGKYKFEVRIPEADVVHETRFSVVQADG